MADPTWEQVYAALGRGKRAAGLMRRAGHGRDDAALVEPVAPWRRAREAGDRWARMARRALTAAWADRPDLERRAGVYRRQFDRMAEHLESIGQGGRAVQIVAATYQRVQEDRIDVYLRDRRREWDEMGVERAPGWAFTGKESPCGT